MTGPRASTAVLALVLATALLGPARPAGAADASITLSRSVGPPTTGLAVRGSGFGASETVQLTFDTHPLARARATPAGTFQLRVRVPKTALPGEHPITATGRSSGLVATAPFTVRTDWPMFHFSLNRSGSNPYENVLTPETVGGLELKWAAPILATADSPAVVGGVLYTGDLPGYPEGNLYAFDAATGTRLWSTSLGNEGVCDPAVAGGVVYVGTCINGTVVAVDAATGTKLWTKVTGGGVFFSPAVAEGRVYVGTNAGLLYALNAATGAEIWSASYRGAPGSPAVAGGMVFVGGDDDNIHAFDADTGEQRWVTSVGNIPDTPAVVDGVLYVGTANFLAHTMYAMDANTGAVLWSRELGGMDSELLASPAVADGRVFVGSLNGKLYALDAATGAPLWSKSIGADGIWKSPTVAAGVVYDGAKDGTISALDAATGDLLWSYQAGGFVGPPVVADGVVYVGSFDGHLYAFSLPG